MTDRTTPGTAPPPDVDLPPDARRRYARQLLLPEIRGAGQRRLGAAVAVPRAGADPRAAAVAADYLARAGVGADLASPLQARDDGGLVEVDVPSTDTVAAIAGEATWLREAAAAIAGAFAATEAVKRIVGAGRGGELAGFYLGTAGPENEGASDL